MWWSAKSSFLTRCRGVVFLPPGLMPYHAIAEVGRRLLEGKVPAPCTSGS